LLAPRIQRRLRGSDGLGTDVEYRLTVAAFWLPLPVVRERVGVRVI
jgi:hypothetical protein